MKLSIIIPAYNCKYTLNRALQSALDQTIDDLEVIIVDDGSDDGTSELADNLAARWGRIKVIHQNNAGPSAARQAGLNESTGEWIAFLDSDDYMEPNMCEKLITTCIKEKVDVASCNFYLTYDQEYKGGRWHWTPGKYNIKDNLIWSNSSYDIGFLIGKVYKASTIKKLNIPFPNCSLAEDAVWNAEIFYLLKEIVIIDDTLYGYDISDDSLSHKKLSLKRRKETMEALESLYEKYKGKKGFNEYWKLLRPFMADVLARKTGDKSIDLVVPYVDCNDKNWQKLYNKYSEYRGDEKIRFDNKGMFPIFWRCIANNLKDVEMIHLVVQSKSQIPTWLDTNNIHVVTHDMIMPEDFLPTFNSSSIEMFIQNILGLSNNFIYTNDDFYITSRLSANTFFEGNLPKNTYSKKVFKNSESPETWEATFSNATHLAFLGTQYEEVFNGDYYSMEHTIRAFNRKRMVDVFNIYKQEIYKSITMFREDKNMNIFLFGVYDFVHKKAINKRDYRLEVMNTNDLFELQDRLSRKPQVMSINDTEISQDNDLIKKYMQKLYSKPCKYEVYDSM